MSLKSLKYLEKVLDKSKFGFMFANKFYKGVRI